MPPSVFQNRGWDPTHRVPDLWSLVSDRCISLRRQLLEAGSQWTLYGAFPVKRLFWVVLTVFCSERERPFFVPSPAIRSPERAEGVKGPKR